MTFWLFSLIVLSGETHLGVLILETYIWCNNNELWKGKSASHATTFLVITLVPTTHFVGLCITKTRFIYDTLKVKPTKT